MIAKSGFSAWICYPVRDDWNLRRSGIWNMRRPGIWNLRKSGTCEGLEPIICGALETGTCDVLESRIHVDQELQRVVIFVNKRFKNQREAKSKTLSQRSGSRMWTSGKLVNVWNQPRKSLDVKDIHVHVHTRNIPWIRGYSRDVKIPFVSL
jgi:hypothetical protein